MDPWAIPPDERLRHQQQFASINPTNGFVNGNQAKGFFMQSGLSPMVLAQIWGLADMNGDGQMDINEFSIACKMITMKLKGFELPSQVPPSILMSFQPAQPGMPMMAPGMMGAHPGMMMQPGVSAAGMMGMGGMGMQPGMATMGMHAGMPMQGLPITSVAAPMMPAVSMGMPVSTAAVSMGMPVSSAAPHVSMALAAAPNVHLDWAIPQPTRAKYSAVFAQTDKARTGFLAGVQARNILVQSGLQQNILAQIWTLSDVDGDGRLSTEEFILSGHLCDLAAKGEPMPAALPPNLVPPSMRKNLPPGSDTVSTPGSVHGSLAGSNVGVMDSPSTFEDKRRENFNKGAAELEKRRQSLVEQQKKEEEAKKKKEKEEAEAREKQKQEMERQRLIEWEKQRKEELTAHRQREQDKLLELKARQDNLNKELEAMHEKVKNLTTNISDSRTGVSDVKTFIDGMRTSRDTKMKEMSDLKNKLKDQNQRLIDVTQEKAHLEAKNKTRAAKIAEGEADEGNELTEFDIKKAEKEKEVIALRETFEEVKAKETSAKERYDGVKEALAEHRVELEKVIEACKAIYGEFDEQRREMKAEKAKRIRELTDPDHAWGNDDVVEEVVSSTPAATMDAPTAEAGGDYVQYRALFDYTSDNPDDLHFTEGDIIMVHEGQASEPGWLGGELNGKVGWFPENYAERLGAAPAADVAAEPAAVVGATDVAAVADPAAAGDVAPFIDTCTFSSGRVLHSWSDSQGKVMLNKNEQVEIVLKRSDSWWLGRVNGTLGYMPAVYVLPDSAEERSTTPLDAPPAPEETEMPTLDDVYVAVHPYTSEEPGDLVFEAGEALVVTQKENEWWTGEINGGEQPRIGVFPYNYVEAVSTGASPAGPAAAATNGNGNGSAAASQDLVAAAAAVVDSTPAAAPAAEDGVPPPDPATSGKMSKSNTLKKSKKKKKKDGDAKMELAKVVAPYEATSKEQLTLAKGQMLLIRKKTETGWWQGEIQGAKGQKRETGWFPASYVKLMESKAEAPPKAAEPVKYRAVHDFAGTQEDELSFSAGQSITLLAKQEADWWQGEVDGRTGVFPSNYVEPIE